MHIFQPHDAIKIQIYKVEEKFGEFIAKYLHKILNCNTTLNIYDINTAFTPPLYQNDTTIQLELS